jgi:hypothetical protein
MERPEIVKPGSGDWEPWDPEMPESTGDPRAPSGLPLSVGRAGVRRPRLPAWPGNPFSGLVSGATGILAGIRYDVFNVVDVFAGLLVLTLLWVLGRGIRGRRNRRARKRD